MKSKTQSIPDKLIYERDGDTIYYVKGYRDMIKNNTIERTMSSYFQGFLTAELIHILGNLLGEIYRIATNEFGLQFAPKVCRKADIAIFLKSKIAHFPKTYDKYVDVAPEVVIEIDTQLEFSNWENADIYFTTKTNALLGFGVKKVIWIFSKTEKITIAEQGKRWQVFHWSETFNVLDKVSLNIKEVVDTL